MGRVVRTRPAHMHRRLLGDESWASAHTPAIRCPAQENAEPALRRYRCESRHLRARRPALRDVLRCSARTACSDRESWLIGILSIMMVQCQLDAEESTYSS